MVSAHSASNSLRINPSNSSCALCADVEGSNPVRDEDDDDDEDDVVDDDDDEDDDEEEEQASSSSREGTEEAAVAVAAATVVISSCVFLPIDLSIPYCNLNTVSPGYLVMVWSGVGSGFWVVGARTTAGSSFPNVAFG